jgi:hypothetical protein
VRVFLSCATLQSASGDAVGEKVSEVLSMRKTEAGALSGKMLLKVARPRQDRPGREFSIDYKEWSIT